MDLIAPQMYTYTSSHSLLLKSKALPCSISVVTHSPGLENECALKKHMYQSDQKKMLQTSLPFEKL